MLLSQQKNLRLVGLKYKKYKKVVLSLVGILTYW